jgi:hypothetical protein
VHFVTDVAELLDLRGGRAYNNPMIFVQEIEPGDDEVRIFHSHDETVLAPSEEELHESMYEFTGYLALLASGLQKESEEDFDMASLTMLELLGSNNVITSGKQLFEHETYARALQSIAGAALHHFLTVEEARYELSYLDGMKHEHDYRIVTADGLAADQDFKPYAEELDNYPEEDIAIADGLGLMHASTQYAFTPDGYHTDHTSLGNIVEGVYRPVVTVLNSAHEVVQLINHKQRRQRSPLGLVATIASRQTNQ